MCKMLSSLVPCQQLMCSTNDPELAHPSSVLKNEYLGDMLVYVVLFWIAGLLLTWFKNIWRTVICSGLKRLNIYIYLRILSFFFLEAWPVNKHLGDSTDCMFPVNGMLLKSETCPAGTGRCVAQETFKSPFLMTQDRCSKWQVEESYFVCVNKEEECWVLINMYEALQKLIAKMVSFCFKILLLFIVC